MLPAGHVVRVPKIRLALALGAGIGIAVAYFLIRRFIRSKKLSTLALCSGMNGCLRTSAKKDRNLNGNTVPKPKLMITSSNKRIRSVSSDDSEIFEDFPRRNVTFKDDLTNESPLVSAKDYLSDAVKQWEKVVDVYHDTNNINDQEKHKAQRLETILSKSKILMEKIDDLLQDLLSSDCVMLLKQRDRYLTYDDLEKHKKVKRTMSVLSDDSFVSAVDNLMPPILDLQLSSPRCIEADVESLEFYNEGLYEVDSLNVVARVLRTEILKCKSDDDFLAKLYCIRRAFEFLLEDSSKKLWLVATGRKLLISLLNSVDKQTEAESFAVSYDKLMTFLSVTDNWRFVDEELRGRKVVEVSFYDVVLDFVFMDAFEDLANPPASVLAVAQNRFLSKTIVEKTLSAVVWSVLRAKRARLKYPQGFIAHFYEISEQVSPTLAWGFLGSDQRLKDTCNYFKSQVCNFLIDLFNSQTVRFTKLEELAEDIWEICQTRAQMTLEKLSK